MYAYILKYYANKLQGRELQGKVFNWAGQGADELEASAEMPEQRAGAVRFRHAKVKELNQQQGGESR